MAEQPCDHEAQLKQLNAQNQQLREQLLQLQAQIANLSFADNISTPITSDASASLLRMIIEASTDAYVEWNAESRKTVYSEQIWSMLGYQPGEYVNTAKHVFSQVHPEDQSSIYRLFQRATQTGEGYSTEFRVFDKQGNIVWLLIRAKVFGIDRHGQAQRIVGTITNISRLKQVQQEKQLLAETEQWLLQVTSRLFNDADTEAIQFTLEQLGRFLQLDRCFVRMCAGSNRYQMVAEWCSESMHPIGDDFPQVSSDAIGEFSQRIQNGDNIIYNDIDEECTNPEFRKISQAQEAGAEIIVPLLQGNRPIGYTIAQHRQPRQWKHQDLRTVKIIGDAIIMVASQQRILRELEASRERFHLAMEASADGLWDWDINGDNFYFSPSIFRMLGFEPDELPHSSELFRQRLHPDDRRMVERDLASMRRHQQDRTSIEFRMLNKQGKPVWILSRGKVVRRNADGTPARAVGMHTDISAFKHALLEVKSMQEAADAANQAKSEFLARMSHEIRTPMNAIIGLSHLCLHTNLSQEQRDHIEHIDDAAKSLLRIIDDILDFSKIEAGKLDMEVHDFDLEKTLDRIGKLMSFRAEQKGLELIYDIATDVPRYIRGDANRLSQVLTNLLSNAIKFTHTGEIVVNVRHQMAEKELNRGPQIIFSVTDTGIGLNPNQLRTLFDPFTQADGSTSRKYGGTGLGLAICKHLVEMMDGTISVSSEANAGSCFTFNIPYEHSNQSVISEQVLAPLNVLVVDDNRKACDIIAHMLCDWQFHVTTVHNAQDAIKRLTQTNHQHFDLVLMDYKMPGMNGYLAAREIRQLFPEGEAPKLIMVSAYNRNEITQGGPSDFIDSFMTKPVSHSSLYDAIAYLFSTQSAAPHPGQQKGSLLPNATRILLVEDNPVNQRVAIGILQKQGVSVTVANNGREAIEVFMAQPAGSFDLILMDMEMPEMDGYQATRAIRAGGHHNHIPIVAMTAHAMAGDREKCLAAGMDGYIAKPINPQLLYQTIAEFLH